MCFCIAPFKIRIWRDDVVLQSSCKFSSLWPKCSSFYWIRFFFLRKINSTTRLYKWKKKYFHYLPSIQSNVEQRLRSTVSALTGIAFQDSEVKGGKMIITQSVPILPHSLKITYISECYIFFSGSPRKMLSFTFQYFLLLSSLRVCYSVFFAPYKRSEVVWT